MTTLPTLAAYLSRITLLADHPADALVFTAPSESQRGTTHTITVPLDDTRPILCSVSCKAHGPHWHRLVGEELRRRYRDAQTIQRAFAPEFLTLQEAWLHPRNTGAVCVAWLSARRLLAETTARPVAA